MAKTMNDIPEGAVIEWEGNFASTHPVRPLPPSHHAMVVDHADLADGRKVVDDAGTDRRA